MSCKDTKYTKMPVITSFIPKLHCAANVCMGFL